jgi:CheY-like chemotaxis protein
MGGDITVHSEYGKGSVFTARIPQRLHSGERFAAVENPGEKPALVYEDRGISADAIRWSLDNLVVPHTLVTTEEGFREAMACGGAGEYAGEYAFAFIAYPLYERVRPVFEALDDGPHPVLLADYGSEPGIHHLRLLTLPAHTLAIANILNHKPESRSAGEGRSAVKFTAPSARVLIVDDIATNLKVAQGLLVPYDMIIDTCLSGPVSIELLKKNKYDLVFMDHMMPGMDGAEAVRIIRNMDGDDYFKQVPIVALTANAVSGMKEMFLQRGFNDYLAKPIEMFKLHEILEKWIPGEKRTKPKDRPEAGVHTGMFDGKRIDGIDLAAGTKRFGDGPVFLEILRSYAGSIPDFLDALKNVSRENLDAYAVTVHGIKGSSFQICAGGIGKEAEILEAAAKAGDWETVSARNDAIIGAMETLLGNLEVLLAETAGGAAEKAAAGKPDPALLDRLLKACKDYDMAAMEEALAGLEAHTYKTGGELVSWLRKQVDNVEYEAIRERLEKGEGNDGTGSEKDRFGGG